MKKIKEYYGEKGKYLKEHKNYLSDKNLKRDVDFIIKSLKIKKEDKCLDLQCAQGRITLELNSRKYSSDGLDFSKYMISLAQKEAKAKKIHADFFIQDLNKIKLTKKYTKVFMFFSDWNNLNFEKILPQIKKVMKKGGLFLYDHDNLFRIWDYLEKNPKKQKEFIFDSKTMTLNKKNGNKDRYYTYLELENIFIKNGFEIIDIYGGGSTKEKKYNYNSPRLRIIAKKI